MFVGKDCCVFVSPLFKFVECIALRCVQASADSLPATAPANGSLEDLLERVLQNPRWSGRRTLDWVRARIRTMWPRWLDAGRTLLENNPFARQQLRGGWISL